MVVLDKGQIVNLFLDRQILLSPDFFVNPVGIDRIMDPHILVLTKDTISLLSGNVNWFEIDQARASLERGFSHSASQPVVDSPGSVRVVFSYDQASRKRTIQDFVSYFNSRFGSLERILRNRQEFQNVISINRIANKNQRESVSLIGMVRGKSITNNGNCLLELEDPSGVVKIVISKSRNDLFSLAEEIVLDEVLGVVGQTGSNIVFASSIIFPDIPLSKEFKKSPDESFAVFISDIHLGSVKFLPNEFNQFIEWINGNVGTPSQREIAQKVKYLFVIGDLIDGIGIYPGQEDELVINDIYQQYEGCAKFLARIPSHIKIIVCPGNHDAMRIAEPQPVLYKDFAKSVWDLPNVVMVSNPSVVNIDSSPDFSGFDVLLYHGYCFDYYVANVGSIRNNGGYDRADLMMKFLLQKRHLAPTHKSTLYIPEPSHDPLVIDKVPDFFVTGHIHSAPVAANYRNITMLSCGCWQSKTPFQEKVGHNPGPCKVPIVNLKTRQVKILKFAK